MVHPLFRRPGPLLAGAALLLVAGCGGSPSPTATPDQVELLVVVTPTPGPPPTRDPDRSAERRHVVREGDTLSAIAMRYEVSEEELARVNRLTDPSRLVIGQELVIPPPEP